MSRYDHKIESYDASSSRWSAHPKEKSLEPRSERETHDVKADIIPGRLRVVLRFWNPTFNR